MTYEIVSIRTTKKEIKVVRPDDLFPFIKRYAKSRQEHFLVITLDTEHKVIGIHISTIGLMNKTTIHPREVFYHAIKDNACAIMLAHNHPSGQLKPSPDDEEMTKRLVKAGEIMGFLILDHLIFSKDSFYSFRQSRHESLMCF